MQWDQKNLKLLGLGHIELKILESIIEPKNPTEISKLTGEIRTSINYNLKKLIERGLVERIKTGRRYLYVSQSPAEIRRKLQNMSDLFGPHSEGIRIKTNKEDEFIVHVGANEIVPAFIRIALEIKNERVKAIQHHKSFTDLLSVASKEQIETFNEAIKKNKIIVDGMLNESAYKNYYQKIKNNPEDFFLQIKTLEGRMADYSVFPDDKFDFHSEIWIFKTTTLIINWKEKVGIEVTNANITNLLREMFEYVKESSRKIDHNKMMRELKDSLDERIN